jgi:DNA polymerase-3 subunit chi
MDMVDISFHTGVDDRTTYACRLLRKAARQGARVLVRGASAEMDLLDKALWTFEAQEFVPHHRLRPGQTPALQLARTPVWLMDVGEAWPEGLAPAQVLLQMAALPAEDAPMWSRLIELVGDDPDDRRQARQRWRAYETQGLPVKAVNVGSSPT